MGDFDGDGRSDLAWTKASTQGNGLGVHVALSNGDGTFARAKYNAPRTSGNFTSYAPHVGDFDGDGNSDLVWARGFDGPGLRAYVALSNTPTGSVSGTTSNDSATIYRDAEYDALGRVVRRSRAYFAGDAPQWGQLSYDKLGRVKRETRPDGGWTDIAYDGVVDDAVRRRIKVFAAGSAEEDAQAQISTRESDALGRLVRVSDALSNSTTYAYDALGNLLTTTDASGNRTSLTYDLRGRKTSMTDPDMGAWTYSYNALGELVSQSDAKGQTVTMVYDALGRMTRRTEAEGTTTWSYDTATKGKGKLHQVSAPTGYLRTHAYDSLGRPESESTTITMETFTTSRTYDAAGRVATVTYPETGFSVGHTYTSAGYLHTLYEVESPETVHWRAEAVSAEGQLTGALSGNGVGTTRTYDPETGLVTSIQSGLGDTADVQDLGYVFDSLGNLETREDFLQDVYESFTYDTLNRLTGATVYGAVDDAERVSKRYAYDAIGNLVNKSDVSAADYVYGTGNAAGAGDAGPHAVVSAGDHTYAYDDNGNMTSGAGRTLAWTSHNKPRTLTTATTTTTFVYGPERARIQQRKVQGATTTTIKYVGTGFEQIAKTGEATRYVHYLFAGSERVAIYTEDDAPTPTETLRYLHTDHLGSVDAITDEAGAVVERLSYDAFGKRRIAEGADAWQDPALAIAGGETPRGFTGHEHLDDFALVHMNGRVYDPHLGRFTSADPFIQLPASTQGLNRYSYVLNNPLSLTDPSGYFIKWAKRKVTRLVRGVGRALRGALKSPIVQTAVSLYICSAGPQACAAASATFTALNGGDLGEVVFAAALTFVSAEAYGEVGRRVTHPAAKTVAHGVVGGVVAELGGGRFRTGFISAGAAQFAAPWIDGLDEGNSGISAARVTAAAVVGGTVARLGGGKFANGAVTAAFGRLFNLNFESMHESTCCFSG